MPSEKLLDLIMDCNQKYMAIHSNGIGRLTDTTLDDYMIDIYKKLKTIGEILLEQQHAIARH